MPETYTQPEKYNQNVNDVTVNVFYWMDANRSRFQFRSKEFSQPMYVALSWIEDDCEVTY
jgi:hypothetical protein